MYSVFAIKYHPFNSSVDGTTDIGLSIHAFGECEAPDHVINSINHPASLYASNEPEKVYHKNGIIIYKMPSSYMIFIDSYMMALKSSDDNGHVMDITINQIVSMLMNDNMKPTSITKK